MNPSTPYQTNANNRLKLVVIALLFVVAAVFGLLALQSSRLHIVSTNPDTGNVSTISPFLRVNFNKQLSNSDVTVTSSPSSIITSNSVNGKTLEIVLQNPLSTKTKYTVTISVSSTDGQKVTKKISFTPNNTPYDKLPQDQKDYLKAHEAPPSASVDFNPDTTYEGTSALVNLGITAAQVNGLTGAFSKFSPKTKAVVIDMNSVVQGPHDKTGAQNDSITFNVAFDSVTYKAKLEYGGLTDLRLYLYDQNSGNTVYDSGTLSGLL